MNTKEDVCRLRLMASRDALGVLQGKWRIPIIISLTFANKRFGEIRRDIPHVSPKMLSQELKALEMNQIITRTMYDSMPVSVEYTLTPMGCSMKKLLKEILDWGTYFREEVIGK